MYYDNYRPMRPGRPHGDDRFIVPFLLGGLAGSAAVGLTRPRPVFVNPPYRPYPPYYGSPYYYNSNSFYGYY